MEINIMQVFLPFPSFEQSVACLDKSRLGNQIWRECKTILNGGWKHHPASKLWIDHKPPLAMYGKFGLWELQRRGNIRSEAFDIYLEFFNTFTSNLSNEYPPFIGNEEFHLSHRLNLLWKNPRWYSQFFEESVPHAKPPYIWPLPQKLGSEMVHEQ